MEVACPFEMQEQAIHNPDEWKNMPKSEDFWDCCIAFCFWGFLCYICGLPLTVVLNGVTCTLSS